MNTFNFTADSIVELLPQDEVWVGNIPYFVDRLAKGGMGFIALLRRDDQRLPANLGYVHGPNVAVKAFLPSEEDPMIRQLFQRELTVWAGLNHPTILKLNEILQTKNNGWVAAMDRCIGSLEDVLAKRQTLPLDDAVFVLNDVIQGLAYASKEHQVMHLDMKPANILCGHILSRMASHSEHPTKQYRWMVSDWGIASVKNATLAKAIESPELKCRYNTLNNIGTDGYMAPERYQPGIRSTIASDVFSLGLILIQMLVGKLPYERHNKPPAEQIVSGSYFHEAKRLLAAFKVPKNVADIALKMISFDPTDRFSDYENLRLTLLKSAQQTKSIFSRFFKH